MSPYPVGTDPKLKEAVPGAPVRPWKTRARVCATLGLWLLAVAGIVPIVLPDWERLGTGLAWASALAWGAALVAVAVNRLHE